MIRAEKYNEHTELKTIDRHDMNKKGQVNRKSERIIVLASFQQQQTFTNNETNLKRKTVIHY